MLLDARARGVISSSNLINVKMTDNKFIADTGKDTILLKNISIIKEETLEDILEELNRLTGLESVKSFINELLQTVKLQKQREELGGKITPMTLHMVYTGNPGTGKTTVARLISRVLKAMGLLSQGQ